MHMSLYMLVLTCLIAVVFASSDSSKCDTSCDSSPSVTYTLRLHPRDNIYDEILNFARAKSMRAASVSTVVGSLVEVSIRFANQENVTHIKDTHLEIVSFTGTISEHPYGAHLHISVGDRRGSVIGGHLMSGIVYTTAEVVITEYPALRYIRPVDPDTGYDELVVCCR